MSSTLLAPPEAPKTWQIRVTRTGFSITCLFEAHRAELESYLKKVFGAGPPEPEDVVQQAFVNLASLGRPEDIRNPRAYLYRTACHIAVDERRRNAGMPHRAADLPLDQERRDERTPERILIAREQALVLAEALRAVPERRRRSFLSHRMDGLSCAEIAGRTGSSASAVKKHVSSTRRDLEAAIQSAEAVRLKEAGRRVLRRRPSVCP